ncbi:MAG: F0F1 ATP synthase subunit A [Lachnospiraceae bacterium]|nr:F0F1 ATP synthase subunit A [Lachnospiraceae bacterium]
MGAILYSSEDMGYMIEGLVSYEVGGQTLWITTTHVSQLIITIVLIIVAFAVRNRMKKAEEVPGTFQCLCEAVVEMLDNMVITNMGKRGRKYCNYIITLFIFILLSNIGGIFGLRSPTADYGVTLMLALVTFVMIHYNGIRHQKKEYWKGYLDPFPVFLPVNIISEFATPVSLSLRLFANMVSGTLIMALWYALMPLLFRFVVPAALNVYFDLFSGAIQTYVFCMLTMIFVSQRFPEE